jgi:hypothetical protein
MQLQLYDVCKQFEQVFLSSLVPQSFITLGNGGTSEAAQDTAEAFLAGSGTTAEFVATTFAAALELAGGLGLAGELYHSLQRQR